MELDIGGRFGAPETALANGCDLADSVLVVVKAVAELDVDDGSFPE